MRITDVPYAPGQPENMEIQSEDIKSATIEVHTLISQFGYFEISDVQGGRIVASARAFAEFNEGSEGRLARGSIGRPVYQWSLHRNDLWCGNGLASDLSIINSIPGSRIYHAHRNPRARDLWRDYNRYDSDQLTRMTSSRGFRRSNRLLQTRRQRKKSSNQSKRSWRGYIRRG